jgi:hypothetical protein
MVVAFVQLKRAFRGRPTPVRELTGRASLQGTRCCSPAQQSAQQNISLQIFKHSRSQESDRNVDSKVESPTHRAAKDLHTLVGVRDGNLRCVSLGDRSEIGRPRVAVVLGEGGPPHRVPECKREGKVRQKKAAPRRAERYQSAKGVPPYLEHSTPIAISASMVPIAWWLMIGTPNVLPVVTPSRWLTSATRIGSKKGSETYGRERTWPPRRGHAARGRLRQTRRAGG